MVKYIVNGNLVLFDPFGKIPLNSTLTDQFGSVYKLSQCRVYIPNKGWGIIIESYRELSTDKRKDNKENRNVTG